MKTNFKNKLARDLIELNRMNEELQAENERLKGENERLKDEREEANSWDDAWKMAERITQLEKCLVKARKEIAKLKCLALHLFSNYFFLCYWQSEGLDPNKYLRLHEKYNEAYRKAKAELKEGK